VHHAGAIRHNTAAIAKSHSGVVPDLEAEGYIPAEDKFLPRF
jgi:hypothetical protein